MRGHEGEFRRRLAAVIVIGSLSLMFGAALVTPFLPRVSAADAYVQISGYTFIPHYINIYPNQVIQWNNTDGVAHTVTSNTSAWTEIYINAGSTGTLTLSAEGTYGYHCRLHSFDPGMWGEITVIPLTTVPELSNLAFVAIGMVAMLFGLALANRRR